MVDCTDQVPGRCAANIAKLLIGKTEATYQPGQDTGGFVVAINTDKLRVTGSKLKQKVYYRHSGYPGGMKSETAGKRRQRRPAKLVEEAVSGMLPKGPLGRKQLKKLKVYAGGEHPHQAQQPVPLDAAQALQSK